MHCEYQKLSQKSIMVQHPFCRKLIWQRHWALEVGRGSLLCPHPLPWNVFHSKYFSGTSEFAHLYHMDPTPTTSRSLKNNIIFTFTNQVTWQIYKPLPICVSDPFTFLLFPGTPGELKKRNSLVFAAHPPITKMSGCPCWTFDELKHSPGEDMQTRQEYYVILQWFPDLNCESRPISYAVPYKYNTLCQVSYITASVTSVK